MTKGLVLAQSVESRNDVLNTSVADSCFQSTALSSTAIDSTCIYSLSYNGQQVQLFSAGDTASVKHYLGGILHGSFISFYANKNIKIKGNYILNELEGEFVKYYPTGKIAAAGRYKDGVPHGYWRNYYPNGKLASEGKLRQNTFEGIWSFYHINGALKQKEFWKERRLMSVDTFYTDEGIAKNLGELKAGNGYRYLYTPKGVLLKKETYFEGLKQGRSTQFFPDEITKKAEYFYQKDTLHGPFFIFNDNGNLLEKGVFAHGKRKGLFETFYPKSGTTQRKGDYVNDSKQGIWKYYNRQGYLQKQVTYFQDKLSGKASYFDSMGVLTAQGYYLDNLKEGTWKYYAPDADSSTVRYANGVKSGEYIVFNDGKIVVKGNFENNLKNGNWHYFSFNSLKVNLFMFPSSRFIWEGAEVKKKFPLIEGYFLQGSKSGTWVYRYLSGKEMFSLQWDNSKLMSCSLFKPLKGKPMTMGNLKEGNGHIKFYDFNGMLYLKGEFKNGVANGKWTFYDEKERLLFQGSFEEGTPISTWFLYSKKEEVIGSIDSQEPQTIRWKKKPDDKRFPSTLQTWLSDFLSKAAN